MDKFTTKTGYAKRISDGSVFEAETIYLGKYDSLDDYAEATKEEFEAYDKAEKERIEAETARMNEEANDHGDRDEAHEPEDQPADESAI